MSLRFPSMMDESQFAFPVAMIRVLETRLLDRQRYERLLDAADAEEVYKILSETEYSEALSVSRSVYLFEDMLAAELSRVYQYITKYVKEPAVAGSLLVRHDFHNLKVLLKEMLLREPEGSGGIFNLGIVPVAELRRGVKQAVSGVEADLPGPYAGAVTEAASRYSATLDPQEIDIAVDSALFSYGAGLARQSGSELLQQLWQAWADLANVKSFVRAAFRVREPGFLSKVLLDGGAVPKENLLAAYKPSIDAIDALIENVKNTPYAELVARGAKDIRDTRSFSLYEKLADNYVMGLLGKSKAIAQGLEPVIAYLLAKENEIKNLRIILTGKINRLAPNAIRGRLRDAYV